MELVPWRPFREMGSLRRELDDMWRRFFMEPFAIPVKAEEWLPPVDIVETTGYLTIKIELPGIEAKDIDLRVNGDLLILRGEKKREEETQEHQYCCREICSGTFQRSFRLPSEVSSDRVEAKLKDGVLRIVLPKSGTPEKKRIEIEV